jgi:hypothetical protein
MPREPQPNSPLFLSTLSGEVAMTRLSRPSLVLLADDIQVLDRLWSDDFTVSAPNNAMLRGKKEFSSGSRKASLTMPCLNEPSKQAWFMVML